MRDLSDEEVEIFLKENLPSDPPDYPNVRRGFGCGTVAAVLMIPGGLLVTAFDDTVSNFLVVGFALVFATALGVLAAYRPPRS